MGQKVVKRNNVNLYVMENNKFHCGMEYKVISATKLHKIIICRIRPAEWDEIFPSHTQQINPAEINSLIIFQHKNPRLYRIINSGIIRNVMPILNGITVVLNSTTCYYTHE
jgi:hypothetical protein